MTSKNGRIENLIFMVGDGGSGRYKVALVGNSSLPTHAIYGARDLSPFGPDRRLPIIT
jgi:hypothetical protein